MFCVTRQWRATTEDLQQQIEEIQTAIDTESLTLSERKFLHSAVEMLEVYERTPMTRAPRMGKV